ncbi:hypothetical protein ACLMJK_000166 [Lecanora helva]
MIKPSVRSFEGSLQLCYNLPHCVNSSRAYPLKSPNGSTIVIYGNDNGLRIIWRGGRPLREPRETTQEKPKPNGADNDAIMILDSSDEEPGNDPKPNEEPAFHDEEDEYDPSAPYEPIIKTLDLPLGIEVVHLSVPYLPSDLHRSSLPTLLSESLLVAMACSDSTIRVLSLPLTPPSTQQTAKVGSSNSVQFVSTEKSLFGEQLVILSNGPMHQSTPKGVSITLTAATPEDPEDVDMNSENEDTPAIPASRHALRSQSRSRLGKDQSWDLLIASHSVDLSGRLLIHRIPLVAEGTKISTDTHVPWRTQHLASPAVSVEFSSALYPAPQHSQLLIAEAKGVVRLFDCLPQSSAAQGSWLVSLHTDFEKSQFSLPKRKPLLDAKWVLGGKAILVLQVDGEWGVWNHEGRGPMPTEPKSTSLLTSFALSGWVGASLKTKPLLKSSSNKTDTRSKLAPMTPSTRKMKQDALFTGPSTSSASDDGPVWGGISVFPVSDTTNSSKPDDESVLLWHGPNVIVIPSLLTHWQNKVRGSGNLFGSGAKGEPRTLNNIQLYGERCQEIHLLPPSNHQRLQKSGREASTQQSDILALGEKRFVIVTSPLTEPEIPAAAAAAAADQAPFDNSTDQQLLAQGELDVTGMDRILNDMSNNRQRTPRRRSSQASNGQTLLSI